MGSQVHGKEKREKEREREKRKKREGKEKETEKKKVRSLDEWIFSKLVRQENKFSLQSLLCKTFRSFAS
jgi:hypothetical protein